MIHRVFAPTPEQLAWAEDVIGAYEEGCAGAAERSRFGGEMIDLPVVERARKLLAASGRESGSSGETQAAPKAWRGRFYEDFDVGDVYRARLGRTITETDNIWFTLLTLNTNQMHFNTPYTEGTRFGKPLVNSTFTLALVTGMTVPDTSENATANLAWTEIKLPKPVFVGDTLWAESEIHGATRVQVEPGRRHRHDALPRAQPAARGRDRVPTNVHGLQAGRSRGHGHVPGHRRGLDGVRWRRRHSA